MAFYEEHRYRGYADDYGYEAWRPQRRREESSHYMDSYHGHFRSEDPYRQHPGAVPKRPRSGYADPAGARGRAHPPRGYGRGRPISHRYARDPYPLHRPRPRPRPRAGCHPGPVAPAPLAYSYDGYDPWDNNNGYFNMYGEDYYEEEEEDDGDAYYSAPPQRPRVMPPPPRPPSRRGRYAGYESGYCDNYSGFEPPYQRYEPRPGMKRPYSSPNQARGGARGRGSRGRGRGRGYTGTEDALDEELKKPQVVEAIVKFQNFFEELPKLKKRPEEDIVKAVDLTAKQVDIEVVQVYVLVDPSKPRSQVRVDVFFEDRFVASGVGPDKPSGLLNAYKNILVSPEWQDLSSLVNVSRRLVLEDRKQPGFQHIVCRTNSRDETNNLNVLKNMRLYPVDFSIKLSDVVLIVDSMEGWDANDGNNADCHRYMQYSLSNNGIYMSWKISRGKDNEYSCKMFVQKELLVTASGSTVQAAKHKAAASGLKFLAQTQNILQYVPRDQCAVPSIQVEELVRRAVEKRNAFHKTESQELDQSSAEGQKWMEKVMEEVLDEYCQKIGVAPLIIKAKDDFPFMDCMQDMVCDRGLNFGSHNMTGIRHFTINRRPKRSPQEIANILQLCGGKSSRYELVVCNQPLSPERLERARQQFFANQVVTG